MKGAENYDDIDGDDNDNDNDEYDDNDEYENDVGNEHVTIWDEHSISEWARGGAATATGARAWMQLGKENDQMHVMAEPHPLFSSVQ